jgi:hypothetical protein
MVSLPPDLDRLGEQLASAAARRRDERHRLGELRRRVALAGVIGALAFVMFSLSHLGPAIRDFTLASTVDPPGCEHPRGAGFMLPRCEPAPPAQPHRPYAWR